MKTSPMPDPRQSSDMDFRAYWTTLLKQDSPTPAMIIPVAHNISPHFIEYDNPEQTFYVDMPMIQKALGTPHFLRIPVRELFGQPVHIYVLGIYVHDPKQAAEVQDLPLNLNAMRLLTQGAKFKGAIHGVVVLVRQHGFCSRDTDEKMVKANAATIIEVERDFMNYVGDAADTEYKHLTAVLEEGAVLSVEEEVPSLDAVSWMIRVMINGMMSNFEMYTSIREMVDTMPMANEAFMGLHRIQESYFAKRYDEFGPEDEGIGTYEPPHVSPPPGYSKRHRKVVH